jgi:hypothetical protein
MSVIKKTKTFSKFKTKTNSRKKFNKYKKTNKNRDKTRKMSGGGDINPFHVKEKQKSFHFKPKIRRDFTVEHLKAKNHNAAHLYLNSKKQLLTPAFFERYKSLQNAPSNKNTKEVLTELFTVPDPVLNPKNPFNTPREKIFVNDHFIDYLAKNEHKIAELLDHQETKQAAHNYIKRPEIEKHFTPDFFKKFEKFHSDDNNDINTKLNNLFSHPNPNTPGHKIVSDEFIDYLKEYPNVLKELLEDQYNEHQTHQYINSKKAFLSPEFFEKYDKITEIYEDLKTKNITFRNALDFIFSHPQNKEKTFVNNDFLTYLETNPNPNIIVNLLKPHNNKSNTQFSTNRKETNPQNKSYYTTQNINPGYIYATETATSANLEKTKQKNSKRTQKQIKQQQKYNSKLKEYHTLSTDPIDTVKRLLLVSELGDLAKEYRYEHGMEIERYDKTRWMPYTLKDMEVTKQKYEEEEKQRDIVESDF